MPAALVLVLKQLVKKLVVELVFKTARDLAYLALGCLVVFVMLSANDVAWLQGWAQQPWGLNRLSGAGATIMGVPPSTIVGGAPGNHAPIIGPVQGGNLPPPPSAHWSLMVEQAAGRQGCTFQPVWLAAIAFYESGYGSNNGPSSAGAWGYGQFMPETLAAYHISLSQATDYRVMIPAMALFLCRAGIATNIDGALLAYNHSQAYVEWVKYLASTWALSQPPQWRDGPPWNQYSRSAWTTPGMFETWHAAACSAATLAWMLRAYGQSDITLDRAVNLLGPNISTIVGLNDHTGSGLAATMATQHLSVWNLHLNSTSELTARIDQGPVALDGYRWFGVGHWFVAVSHDSSGIGIRESSGNDIRYLTWSQLYGPVGWSGWAVGVLRA